MIQAGISIQDVWWFNFDVHIRREFASGYHTINLETLITSNIFQPSLG